MLTWDAYPAGLPTTRYDFEAEAAVPAVAAAGRVARLAFDPTGRYLVTMPQYDARLANPPAAPPATVWRPDGTKVGEPPPLRLGSPMAVAVGPAGAWVAAGFVVYEDEVSHPLRQWTPDGALLAERLLGSRPEDIRLLPDGGLLVAAGSVWRFPPGLAGEATRLKQAGTAEVVRVAVGDGWLAGASKARATVWDAAGKRKADREHKKGPQNGPVAFRPHSTVLAVGHGTVVDLWDWVSGTEVVLKGHKRPVWAVGFGPDGGTAYTAASDGAVIAWDADTGAVREKFDFGTGKLYSAAVSPDGLTLALGGDDGRVTVVDLDG